MLIDMMSGKTISRMPYAAEFRMFMSRLSAGEIDAIKYELNARIDGTQIQTSSWMPGANWQGTVFQPIYEKAAGRDYTASARCFGLMVWQVFMERPERWSSGHFEKNGEPIKGRTYFRVP